MMPTVLLVRNMDVVFFFYGLAFLFAGLLIFWQTRVTQKSKYELIHILWLLGMFSLIHGANELVDMFTFIKGEIPFLKITGSIALALSYLFLFTFGYQLINLGNKKIIRPLLPLLVLAGYLTLPSLQGINSFLNWGISARYFLGFTGSLLISFGLISYYHGIADNLSRPLKGAFYFLAAVFGIYSVAGGLIVPRADFFPASVVNAKNFIALTGVPVQVLRALCALGTAGSLWNILNIFNREEAFRDEGEEKLLYESDRRFKDLLESVPIGIGIFSPAGAAIEANPALWKMFGFGGKAAFLQFSLPALFSLPEEKETFLSAVKDKGSASDFEARLKRQGGEIFWGKISAAAETTGDWKTLLVCAFEDISEQKNEEEEMFKFKTAVETSPDIIFMTDKNGAFTYVNSEFTRTYGYKSGEVIGRKMTGILENKNVTIRTSTNPLLNEEGETIGFLSVQQKAHEKS